MPSEKPVCRSRSNRTMGYFKIGKGVYQGCILLPCLFNLFAEHIMWNSGLDETQAGIKISRRNINNIRYTDDTTLMWESEEEPKSFLMRVKEESAKAGLKLSIQEAKIMATRREKCKQWQTLFSWTPKSLRTMTAAMKIKDRSCFLEEKLWQS